MLSKYQMLFLSGSEKGDENRRWGAGGTDGKLLVFDLRTGEPVASHNAAADTLNGVQFHPFLPLAATASGAGSLYTCLPLSCHLTTFAVRHSHSATNFIWDN